MESNKWIMTAYSPHMTTDPSKWAWLWSHNLDIFKVFGHCISAETGEATRFKLRILF